VSLHLGLIDHFYSVSLAGNEIESFVNFPKVPFT